MLPVSTDVKSAGKLPFFFLISGIFSLLLSNILLFWAVPDLAAGIYRTPTVWAWAHLFILGFATMVAMGAMYQLVPVALQVSVKSLKLGYYQFFIYAIGVFGLAIGFFSLHLPLLIASGILVFVGFLLFIHNMMCTIRQMTTHTDISKHIMSALIYLLLTVLLGLLFVLNLKWGFLGTFQSHLYYVHFIMGLVGWFTLLIFGFSYKMLPMFSLSHGFGEKRPAKVLLLTHAGVLISIIGALVVNRYIVAIGILIILSAYAQFMLHARDIVLKRMKRNLDIGVKASIVGIGLGCLALLVLVLFIVFYPSEEWILASVLLFIYGWLGFSITGYLYKIVPFLWWTHKYSSRIGKENVPQLKDLTSETLGKKLFILKLVGILLFSISIGFHAMTIMWIMAAVLLVATLIYSVVSIGVFQK
ncbi:MAG TPA: hypothetical protein VJ824_12085 [Bacillota bacterium]|nr:hypothetical protein [Bacillota bacterium]